MAAIAGRLSDEHSWNVASYMASERLRSKDRRLLQSSSIQLWPDIAGISVVQQRIQSPFPVHYS
uniref:Uncharacterized protein n=1 Tax=Setaria digitata TaxID=48799 RepID=A0A915PFX5_9BILA